MWRRTRIRIVIKQSSPARDRVFRASSQFHPNSSKWWGLGRAAGPWLTGQSMTAAVVGPGLMGFAVPP